MSVTWYPAGRLDEIDAEEPFGAVLGGRAIGLYRVEDDVVALDDWCPHQADIRLSDGWIEDGKVVCPMHQSEFELRSGRCMSPPASDDVKAYPVRIDDGVVMVGIESGDDLEAARNG